MSDHTGNSSQVHLKFDSPIKVEHPPAGAEGSPEQRDLPGLRTRARVAEPRASKRFPPPVGLAPDAHERLPRNVRGAGGCQGAGFPVILSAVRRKPGVLVLCLFAMVMAAGCASTKVTNREELVTEKLPRPAHIWVHDFAATAADVPAESALAGENSENAPSQTAEHIATGRKLGAEIAAELVKQIRGMGMPAELAATGTKPEINDLVIRGYLVSFEEGSARKRVTIGLGSGSSELKVAAEGFQATPHGLRKLGSGETGAGGSKTPGTAVGAASFLATHNPAGLIVSTGVKVHGEKSGSSTVEGRAEQTAKEIGDLLKKRFEGQGWIK